MDEAPPEAAPAVPAPEAPAAETPKEATASKELTAVSALRPGTNGHSLLVKVVEVRPPLSIPRPDGGSTRIVEALVGDATGAILLTARHPHAELLKEGQVLSLTNARVNLFQGTPRLAADRNGTIQVAEGAHDIHVQTALNMSLVEYDVIAT